MRLFATCLALLLLPLALLPVRGDAPPKPTGPLAWKKTVVDRKFRSEGVAVADVNKDGKLDILVGDLWYEAPDWKQHPIRKVGDYGNGANGYSQSFAVFAEDLNGDGWVDQIVIGFPGAPCHWYENPKGKDEPWKQHEIWHSACNETPLYADLFGTGKRVLVMGWQPKGKDNEGQMAWFAPGADPTTKWEMHPISMPSQPGKPVPGTFKFAHGLGVGDVNGDGRKDVICTAGWWEQPAKGKDATEPWTFHPAPFGDACADMYAYDLDGQGQASVVSSSAHRYGIWSFRPRTTGGKTTYVKQDLFPKLISQTHALHCVDLDGDGLKDLVTGKRFWAHGPKGDADPNDPAVVYWFRAKKSADGAIAFTPHRIDNDSGIGTQFEVIDINGDKRLDIVTANKKGVFILEQVPPK